MGLNLNRLAEALKVNTEFSYEDRVKLDNMRKEGCGMESAFEEILAGKILNRIEELVNKIE